MLSTCCVEKNDSFWTIVYIDHALVMNAHSSSKHSIAYIFNPLTQMTPLADTCMRHCRMQSVNQTHFRLFQHFSYTNTYTWSLTQKDIMRTVMILLNLTAKCTRILHNEYNIKRKGKRMTNILLSHLNGYCTCDATGLNFMVTKRSKLESWI